MKVRHNIPIEIIFLINNYPKRPRLILVIFAMLQKFIKETDIIEEPKDKIGF